MNGMGPSFHKMGAFSNISNLKLHAKFVALQNLKYLRFMGVQSGFI